VKNPQALQTLRAANVGDEVLFYHTGNEKAIVGLAKITKGPIEDPAHPGTNEAGAPKFALVELAPVKAAKSPVTLAAIKADKRFAEFLLVKNSRLSAMPVPVALDNILRRLAGFE